MKLLCVLLALLVVPDEPSKVITVSGSITINRQIGGKPIEYMVTVGEFSDSTRIPLIVTNEKIDVTIMDVIDFDVPVTVTGLLIQQRYRNYLVVDKITLMSK